MSFKAKILVRGECQRSKTNKRETERIRVIQCVYVYTELGLRNTNRHGEKNIDVTIQLKIVKKQLMPKN